MHREEGLFQGSVSKWGRAAAASTSSYLVCEWREKKGTRQRVASCSLSFKFIDHLIVIYTKGISSLGG